VQIDDLVVTLALDPTNFVTKSKAAREDLSKTQAAGTKVAKSAQENFGKTAEASVKSSNLMESGAKKVSEGFSKLAETALGMFAVFTSVKGMETFIANTTRSDAAVGRLANNLGIAAKVLGGWEGAVRSVGGTAGDLDTAMQAISNARAGWEIRRDTGNDSIWNFLGISADDLKDAPGVLEKLAEAQKRLHLSNRDFSNMLGNLGIPQPVIDFLEKGPAYVQAHVAEFEKLAPSKEQTKEAADRQTAFETLDSTITQIGRELLHDVNPGLKTFLGVLQNLADWGTKHPDLFGLGAGAAATGAGAVALAGIRKLLGLAAGSRVTAAQAATVAGEGVGGAALVAAAVAAGIIFTPSGDTDAGEQEELHKRGLAPRDNGRTVTTGTADTALPPTTQGLLNVIASGESADKSHPGGNYGRQYGSLPDITDFSGPLHGQSVTLPDGSTTHAAGRYQFEPATWDENAAAIGVKDSSPASQDKVATHLAASLYAKATGRDLQTDLEAHDAKLDAGIKSALVSTWPSLARLSDQQFASMLDGSEPKAEAGMTFGTPINPKFAPGTPETSSGPGLHPDFHKLLTAATKPTTDLSHAGMVFDRAAEQWIPISSLKPGMGGGSTVNNHDNSTTSAVHVNGPISIVAPDGSAEGIAKSLKSRLASYNVVNQSSTGMA
jgi:muramidase (phage lysozyme)